MKTYPKLAFGCALTGASTLANAATESALPVMSTLVSLFLVLAAIGVAAFLVKRLAPGGSPHMRLMRVVSQLPLGAREKVTIVELDDQWLVLGVTAQQITLLAQTARKASGAPLPQNTNFSKLFDLARGKHDKA